MNNPAVSLLITSQTEKQRRIRWQMQTGDGGCENGSGEGGDEDGVVGYFLGWWYWRRWLGWLIDF